MINMNAFDVRAGLMVAINQNLDILNKDLIRNPSEVEIEKLRLLLDDLTNVVHEVGQSKQGVVTSCRQCFINKKTFVFLGVVSAVGVAMQAVSQYMDSHENLPSSCQKLSQTTTIGIIALCITGLAQVGWLIHGSSQAELTAADLLIREQAMENRLLHAFVTQFELYKKTAIDGDSTATHAQLKRCLESYKQIPADSKYKRAIPSHDRWVSAMIKLLPANDSLKLKLAHLYKITETLQPPPPNQQEATDHEEFYECSVIDRNNDESENINGDNTLNTNHNTTTNHQAINIVENVFSPTEDEMVIPMKSLYASSASSSSSSSSSSSHDLDQQSQKLKYDQYWKEIEELLGSSIKTFDYPEKPGVVLIVNKEGRRMRKKAMLINDARARMQRELAQHNLLHHAKRAAQL